jgi:hypothetical protein
VNAGEVAFFTHSIGDLFNRLDIIARNQLVVCVEELDTRLFECTLSQEETLDARQACNDDCQKKEYRNSGLDLTFVWIVICLLDKRKLFTLGLIQTTCDKVKTGTTLTKRYQTFHGVRFLQLFERQYEEFGIVLIREWPLVADMSLEHYTEAG